MSDNLFERTLLITGAASGLGEAWARGFLAERATVIAADIDLAALQKIEGAHIIQTEYSLFEASNPVPMRRPEDP